MRRLQFGLLSSALSVLALGVLLAGCSGKKDDAVDVEPSKPRTTSGQPPKTGGTAKLIEGKGTGTLKGKITVKGDLTKKMEDLTKNFQTQIAGKPDDKSVCMAGSPAEITEQIYRIGANKQLGNVVVWLMPPDKDSYFKIDDKQLKAADHKVEIGQPHCAFLPHVATLFPSYHDPKDPKKLLPTGQTLWVKNDAKISHNTNWGGGQQPPGNKLLSPDGKTEIEGLVPDYKQPLAIKCNIHGWMDAYVWIFPHPYATVSKSDTAPQDLQVKAEDPSFGTYEIQGVPTGVPVRIVAWHEPDQFLTNPKGDEITLKDGENTKDFELEP